MNLFSFFFFFIIIILKLQKREKKIRGHGEAWELRNVKWFTRRTEETFLATFISLTCVGRVYATRTSRIFCSVHKKKRSLECYNKLYLLTASVFVHRDSVLTLARCFPRFKRDYSSFIFFFIPFKKYQSSRFELQTHATYRRWSKFHRDRWNSTFYLWFFFFISSKGKRKRIGLKFERMRGHRSGKIIFPGWKLYRFALECLIKDRILSLAGFVLPTMNRRDLAINGNREFLLGLARRCFVAWQCMMYSLWIYRRKRTHTNLYAYIDVSCTHTYTHTHTWFTSHPRGRVARRRILKC